MSNETAFLGIAEGLKNGDNSALERLYKDKCDMAISYLITTFGLQESDTFATNMSDAGVNIQDIRDLLGHMDIAVTANVYVGKVKKQNRKAVDALPINW